VEPESNQRKSGPALGPVSRKRQKLFGPEKPFLVNP